MKKIIVQLWALSLLLLNISCIPASNTPTYTLTPPVSNVWDLDIYSNSNLSALALVGPQGQGNPPNIALLMNAINTAAANQVKAQAAQTNVYVPVVPVVAQFFMKNGSPSVKFSQGSTEIATYTMPATKSLEPFAWLQPWVGKTPLGINIYAIAQANGTINIRLHIDSTVITPTYSLGRVWNLDVITYRQTLNAFNLAGPYPDSVVTNTVNPAYLFAALNSTLDKSNSVRVAFRTDNNGHYADLFDSLTSTFLGTYTLLNVPNKPEHDTALAYVEFNLGKNSKTAVNVNEYQINENKKVSLYKDIAQQNDIVNIRFHSFPPPVVKQWHPKTYPGIYDIYFNNNVPGGMTFQTPDANGTLGGMGLYIIPTLQDKKSATISCDYANGQYNCSYPGRTFNLSASSSILSIYVGPDNVNFDQYYKISQEFDCTKQIFLRFNPGVPPTTAPAIPTLQGSSPGIAETINMHGLSLTNIEFSADGTTWKRWEGGKVYDFNCMYDNQGPNSSVRSYCLPTNGGTTVVISSNESVPVYVRINRIFVFDTGITTSSNAQTIAINQ